MWNYKYIYKFTSLYGVECLTVGKEEEQILEKTEMRMLRSIKGVTLRDKVKSVDIRKELGVNSIKEKVRDMRLRWYGHMQRMEENNEVRAVVDMRVPGKRPLCPKGYAGTTDHLRGCPGQNILEIKNSGHWSHLEGKGEEEEEDIIIWTFTN